MWEKGRGKVTRLGNVNVDMFVSVGALCVGGGGEGLAGINHKTDGGWGGGGVIHRGFDKVRRHVNQEIDAKDVNREIDAKVHIE